MLSFYRFVICGLLITERSGKGAKKPRKPNQTLKEKRAEQDKEMQEAAFKAAQRYRWQGAQV